jgi:F-type H+-transporting ATPase subunit c
MEDFIQLIGSLDLVGMLKIICATFSIAVGVAFASVAQGRVVGQTVEAMARQPEASNDMRFTMIIGLAMIESLAIYCLLLSLIFMFVN